MSTLQEQWRTRAAELESQLGTFLASDKVNNIEVAAVQAAVSREVLIAMADMLDVLEQSKYHERMASQISKWAARNQRVRSAMTKGLDTGDFGEFSNIINEQLVSANGTDAGSGTTESPGQ